MNECINFQSVGWNFSIKASQVLIFLSFKFNSKANYKKEKIQKIQEMKSVLVVLLLVLVCSVQINNVESACAGSGSGAGPARLG